MRWKQVVGSLASVYFDNCIKLQIINSKTCSILIFQERVCDKFLHHIMYDFSRKMFFMRHSINLPISLSDCLYFSRYWAYVCYNCLPGCDVIKFEINLIFLIKLFWYMTKKPRQKLKYHENEKSFWGEIKSIFDHF